MEQRHNRLAALREGDAKAVREWIAQYAPKVRDVGIAYLGSPEGAAALVKQVFAQALTSIRAGYTPADTEDWLLSLARAQGSQAALSRPAQPLPPQPLQPILRPIAPLSPSCPDLAGEPPLEPEQPFALPQEPESPVFKPSPNPEPAALGSGPESPPIGPDPAAGRLSPQPAPILLFDDDGEADSPWEDAPPARRISPLKRFLGALVILLLLLAVAVLFWGLVGLLMGLGVLPGYDLGYTWFNANIYPFF